MLTLTKFFDKNIYIYHIKSIHIKIYILRNLMLLIWYSRYSSFFLDSWSNFTSFDF
jgi:hypothetical protein